MIFTDRVDIGRCVECGGAAIGALIASATGVRFPLCRRCVKAVRRALPRLQHELPELTRKQFNALRLLSSRDAARESELRDAIGRYATNVIRALARQEFIAVAGPRVAPLGEQIDDALDPRYAITAKGRNRFDHEMQHVPGAKTQMLTPAPAHVHPLNGDFSDDH